MQLLKDQDGWSVKKIATLVAVVAIIAAALYVVYDFNGHSLDLSNRQALVVVTDSMAGEPQPYEISTIPVNAMVMIHNMSADDIFANAKIGDVLAFHQGGNAVYVHRIIAIDTVNHTITTHGDNVHEGVNETVYAPMMVGLVVGVSPAIGAVVHFVQANPVLAIGMVVITFVAIFAIIDLVKIVRKRNESE